MFNEKQAGSLDECLWWADAVRDKLVKDKVWYDCIGILEARSGKGYRLALVVVDKDKHEHVVWTWVYKSSCQGKILKDIFANKSPFTLSLKVTERSKVGVLESTDTGGNGITYVWGDGSLWSKEYNHLFPG